MRLIDADAVKGRLEDLQSYTALNKEQAYYRGETNALKIAIRNVENAPTVDAEIVVRCQNCKHHGSCGYEDIPGWFCADGEAKEGD